MIGTFSMIMTTAEKLKKLRESLHATQSEIAGTKYTRSYIGLLESGKELTPAAAFHIAERMNKLAEKRGVDLKVTPEDLLESIETQVNKSLEKILMEISTVECNYELTACVSEIEIFLTKYRDYLNDESKYKMYECIYNKYFDYKDFYNCKIFIIKCFEIANLRKKDTSYLIIMLMRVYWNLNDYENIIVWGKMVTANADTQNMRIIKYNMAMTYKALHKIDECMDYLKDIEKEYQWTAEEIIRNKILYARCLKEKTLLNEALEIYIELLNIEIDNSTEYLLELIYANISEIYIDLEDYKRAEYYLNMSLDICRNIPDSTTIREIYYLAVKLYIIIDKTADIDNNILKIMNPEGPGFSEKVVFNCIKDVIEYYFLKEDNDKIMNLLKLLEHLIINEHIKILEILTLLINTAKHYQSRDILIYGKIINILFNVNNKIMKK